MSRTVADVVVVAVDLACDDDSNSTITNTHKEERSIKQLDKSGKERATRNKIAIVWPFSTRDHAAQTSLLGDPASTTTTTSRRIPTHSRRKRQRSHALLISFLLFFCSPLNNHHLLGPSPTSYRKTPTSLNFPTFRSEKHVRTNAGRRSCTAAGISWTNSRKPPQTIVESAQRIRHQYRLRSEREREKSQVCER